MVHIIKTINIIIPIAETAISYFDITTLKFVVNSLRQGKYPLSCFIFCHLVFGRRPARRGWRNQTWLQEPWSLREGNQELKLLEDRGLGHSNASIPGYWGVIWKEKSRIVHGRRRYQVIIMNMSQTARDEKQLDLRRFWEIQQVTSLKNWACIFALSKGIDCTSSV